MREIEDTVAAVIPHANPELAPGQVGACITGKCWCGAEKRRARMLAAIQMHVDEKTRGRVYLDRP